MLQPMWSFIHDGSRNDIEFVNLFDSLIFGFLVFVCFRRPWKTKIEQCMSQAKGTFRPTVI